MDGGAWWAAVHGVTKSRTLLSDFTFTFHFHTLEKEMTTHSRVPAWRIPGTGEPGGLPSMGLHRVRHDWSDIAVAAAAAEGEKNSIITMYLNLPQVQNLCDYIHARWFGSFSFSANIVYEWRSFLWKTVLSIDAYSNKNINCRKQNVILQEKETHQQEKIEP